MGRSEQTYAAGKIPHVDEGKEKQHADGERPERRALKDVECGPQGRANKDVEARRTRTQKIRMRTGIKSFPRVPPIVPRQVSGARGKRRGIKRGATRDQAGPLQIVLEAQQP